MLSRRRSLRPHRAGVRLAATCNRDVYDPRCLRTSGQQANAAELGPTRTCRQAASSRITGVHRVLYAISRARGRGVLQLGGSREQHVVAYHVTITLSSLNSCLDPVVYCFVPDSFRSTLRREQKKRFGEHAVAIKGNRSTKAAGTPTAVAYSVATLTLTPCILTSRDIPA